LVFALLAEALRRRGELDEAERICAEGLQIHRAYVTGHLVMGDILIDRGRLEEAERAFREVLRLDPNNPVARSSLARIYLARGDAERAIEQLELVLFLYPGSTNAQQLMEQALRAREGVAAAPAGAEPAVAQQVPPAQPAAPPPPIAAQIETAKAEEAEAVRMLAHAPPALSEEELLSAEELSPEQAIFIGEREEEFLRALGHAEGVREAIIVNREGLVVAGSAQARALDDLIGASIAQIFDTAGDQTKRMEFGRLQEVIIESEQGLLRLVRVDERVLAVLVDPQARLGMVNLHINNAISHIRHLRRRS